MLATAFSGIVLGAGKGKKVKLPKSACGYY
jgi:hypothetical protein